jgi:acyl dehydratase
MAERTFTSDDQLAFARLSGDHNPLHVDPLTARRLLFGQPIVHGLHALLWAAEEHLGSSAHGLELSSIQAGFQAPIGLGQTVRCACADPNAQPAEIRLEVEKTTVMWIRMAWAPSAPPGPEPPGTGLYEPGICRQRSFDEAAGASGSLPLHLDRELAARLFPNLTRRLPPMQLAALLATTRLVGMECPGLHSIYSGLDLAFSAGRGGAPQLCYRPAESHRRLALLSMDVEAPGMKGRVKTFFRPTPRAQAAFADLRREVEPGEFSGQRALVVGGSRGLGEVAAKLLAAGGAEVVLTYHRGESDAKRLVEEMTAAGAAADCLPFDVRAPAPAILRRVSDRPKPLFLYYFATPFIFGAARGRFSAERFAAFSEYYVTGFLRTVEAVTEASAGLEKIFYPSSTAIEELPLDMGEYAAAKTAGEILCDFLQKKNPAVVIHKPRLPRLATDQTVSLIPVSSREPVPVLLAHLRHLRQMAAPGG